MKTFKDKCSICGDDHALMECEIIHLKLHVGKLNLYKI